MGCDPSGLPINPSADCNPIELSLSLCLGAVTYVLHGVFTALNLYALVISLCALVITKRAFDNIAFRRVSTKTNVNKWRNAPPLLLQQYEIFTGPPNRIHS